MVTTTRKIIHKVVKDPDGAITEYDYIPIQTGMMWGNGYNRRLDLGKAKTKSIEELGSLAFLCRDIFLEHWNKIVFGSCIEGAVFEIMLTEQPKVTLWDGYLTVILPPGPAHFHLCIGRTVGVGKNKTPEKLAQKRQCKKVAFFRSARENGCVPESYGIRLWNGDGDQMITFFLPNPYITDKQKILKKPDWNRLELWRELRKQHLGE